MATTLSTRRLMKELNEIKTKGTPDGIGLLSSEPLTEWVFTVAVLGDETVYRGEVFALKLVFGPRYPIESPIVTFVADDRFKPPIHHHVYQNGHICASILGTEWSPVLTAVAVCVTMQSMLASAKSKTLPQGHDAYIRRAPKNPKDSNWVYDDDTV